MEIISHRGCWRKVSEKNTYEAFLRSFEFGFGTETDLRDLNGVVVISHDMPLKLNSPISFDEFLSLYNLTGCNRTLALNIKADGLQVPVKSSLDRFSITNYVLFDMSIPDLVLTKEHGLKYLSRVSDLEKEAVLLAGAEGIWLDEFEGGWLNRARLEKVLGLGKRVFVVSSELHGSDPLEKWELLSPYSNENLVLCTDYPEKAQKFFGA